MKTKFYFLAVLAGLTLASCSSDEFVGDNSPNTVAKESTEGVIRFGGNASYMTRATSNDGTAAQMLDGQMKIYGVKKTNGSPATFADVFPDYIVWSDITNITTSNPDATYATAANNGWEYVGTAGTAYGTTTTAGTLSAEQYIKYWDYSTNEYHFVAGSPVSKFTYDASSGDIASASVSGIAGHINPNSGTAINTDPVYIANPIKRSYSNTAPTINEYNTEVDFHFTRQQAYVRVGVFETIPGYTIEDIAFYEYLDASDAWNASPKTDRKTIVLASKTAKYFIGATNATATVNYDWSTTPPSISSITYASGLTEQKNWYGGMMTGVKATTSTESDIAKLYGADADMASTTGYFTVLPMASDADAHPIIVKCDYTLKAIDGTETIKVTGATAAIPEAFCKWKPNTSYTYLFKISDNTNGTTGTTPGTDPEGLFPITFDAYVEAETDGTQQGTITTVTTPSITTYQEGSVTATGIKYVKDKAIYFTAQDDKTGVLNTLVTYNDASWAIGMVNVYPVAASTTEADLILTAPTSTPIAPTIGAAAWPINGQSVAIGKWASFTPTTTGTYAIKYVTSTTPTFSYKVIVVQD